MEEDKSFGLFAAYKCLDAIKQVAADRGNQCYDAAKVKYKDNVRAHEFFGGKALAYYDVYDMIQALIDTLKEAEVKQ